ncbi:Gti1/Pac2 family transcription factor [Nematocida homosporus]|uniref:Gti1/Pac2 family transcription factor n=1 Tax=Nematocida homosporus TaxID=1912981 RepID=UPI00221E4091|nr:Gti1/Pac2 family transcription factor [Nematocida homosporus]KAI5187178.1 Gti1/Pac2 family transcription factor [Nematocida homosporus]
MQKFQSHAPTLTIRETSTTKETIFGALRSEEESLKIIDMARMNVLPRVTSRLTEEERLMIRPGSIYVYEEDESGISRWTDGKMWSSSKIYGRCLIYYQLEAPENKQALESARSATTIEEILHAGRQAISNEDAPVKRESTRDPSGLIKMTISLTYQKKVYHLIAYTTTKFMRESQRLPLWEMVDAWKVPPNLQLRMAYRRKRASLQEIDRPEIPNASPRRQDKDPRRTRSCPNLLSVETPSYSSSKKAQDILKLDLDLDSRFFNNTHLLNTHLSVSDGFNPASTFNIPSNTNPTDNLTPTNNINLSFSWESENYFI